MNFIIIDISGNILQAYGKFNNKSCLITIVFSLIHE